MVCCATIWSLSYNSRLNLHSPCLPSFIVYTSLCPRLAPPSHPLSRPAGEGQGGTSIVVSLPAAPMPQTSPPPPQAAQTPARLGGSLSNRKPGVLPANLEEMKVPPL